METIIKADATQDEQLKALASSVDVLFSGAVEVLTIRWEAVK